MLYMVVERFVENDMRPVSQRVREKGRQLPAGLHYVDSWVAEDFSRCFQLMETEDVALIHEWMDRWDGCGVLFDDVVPVISSAAARERVGRLPAPN